MAKRKEDSEYKAKLQTADSAIGMIHSGQRVFIGSSCGEPQHLVDTLFQRRDRLSDLEIIRLLSLEGSITAIFGDQAYGHNFSVRSIYQGAGRTEHLAGGRRFLTPMNICDIPRLFRSGQLPIHAALIQVSPPDAFGYVSLGISVDITLAAARSARLVIAQVNPRMPRTVGNSFLHVNDINLFVEREEELLTVLEFPEEEEVSEPIAQLLANLVEDGATIQHGPGEMAATLLAVLAGKNDLGLHTQYMTDGIMHLIRQGNITNRYKNIDEGKGMASTAIGSAELYRFLDGNPAVAFHPSDYVNRPSVIAQHRNMVSINVATAMDLTGQVAADALPQNHFAGVTGMVDFVIGANRAVAGKSIIVIPSCQRDGKTSRIVPELDGGSVLVSSSNVHHVVSEFGAVNLFGKNLQERAMAMISIAHPESRDTLLEEAKKRGLVGPERTLSESLYGVYPAHLEEMREYSGVRVACRPVKITDIRGIQEHFYAMEQRDIQSRFFSQRKSFYEDQMQSRSQIDYIKSMTIVAVTGQETYEKIIGIGEYVREGGKNIAEVAFSVLKDWQGKGIARLLLQKITETARRNGLDGLVAYTSPQNRAMIKVFKTLPYAVETVFDGDFFTLTCRFDRGE